MRISDWRSYVCTSDLSRCKDMGPALALDQPADAGLVMIQEAAGRTREIVGKPLLRQTVLFDRPGKDTRTLGPAGSRHMCKQHMLAPIYQRLHQRLGGAC